MPHTHTFPSDGGCNIGMYTMMVAAMNRKVIAVDIMNEAKYRLYQDQSETDEPHWDCGVCSECHQ